MELALIKANQIYMSSTLYPFSVDVDCQGTESALSVTFHHRGKKAHGADFIIGDSKGERVSFSIKKSEDVLQLAKFLEKMAMVQPSRVNPDYSITGYGLKVMSFNKEIAHLNCLDATPGSIDSFSYEGFRKFFPLLDSDDYYFVLYPHQDKGLSKECIETIVDACVSYQNAVIVSGDLSVFSPMRLQDIAGKTGYDKSTVSRACKGACVYTAHRNYSLDNENGSTSFVGLFNQEIGTGVSAHTVRDKIKDIIESEDKSAPLTDNDIMESLSKFGLDVARRTVVKYRILLGFPNSRERRIR